MNRHVLRPSLRQTLHRVAAHAAGGAWSPLDLASLTAWWDFSDAATLYEDVTGTDVVDVDGDYIKHVADKSAGGVNIAANNTDRTHETNIQNGLSIGRFVGTNGYLDSADAVAINNQLTFMWAGKVTEDADMLLHVSNPAQVYISCGQGTTNKLCIYVAGRSPAGWLSSATSIINTWCIVAVVVTTSGVQAYINGGAAEINQAQTGSFSSTYSLSLGRRTDSNEFNFHGDVAEAMVCNAALSTANLNAAGAYLADKWDLTWNTVT